MTGGAPRAGWLRCSADDLEQAWRGWTTADMVVAQRRQARDVDLQTPLPSSDLLVAGVDATYRRGSPTARAAAVSLRTPRGPNVEAVVASRPLSLPYIPGLLSFRELPVVLAALEGLARAPDVILCDGHGLAHPRRFGLACHLGVLLGIPTVGCAKRLLVGEHGPVPEEVGAWRPLLHRGDLVGAVVRTRYRVRPVYVSPGHMVTLATAVDLVLRMGAGYRLPEPTRRADKLLRAPQSGAERAD